MKIFTNYQASEITLTWLLVLNGFNVSFHQHWSTELTRNFRVVISQSEAYRTVTSLMQSLLSNATTYWIGLDAFSSIDFGSTIQPAMQSTTTQPTWKTTVKFWENSASYFFTRLVFSLWRNYKHWLAARHTATYQQPFFNWSIPSINFLSLVLNNVATK